MIDLTLLADGGIGWIDASGPASPLVLSTRIRLARNLAGRPFATRSTAEDREAIAEEVAGAVAGTEALGRAASFRLDRLDLRDRLLLHERHLVSKELAGLGGEPAPVGAMLLVQDRVGAIRRGGPAGQ